MTRRLVLIRHAAAEPAHPAGDHERRLTEEGQADADALGRWLDRSGLAADLALRSTAVRTTQTLERLGEVETWPTRRIYDGGADGVLEAIREVPEEINTLWVVGHEPVMSTLVWELGQPTGELRDLLGRGFPTTTAAVLQVECAWSEVAPGVATPVALHTARADR